MQFNPSTATGVAWDGASFYLTGGPSNEVVGKFSAVSGNLLESQTSNLLIGRKGIVWGNTRFWSVGRLTNIPPVANVVPLDNTLVVRSSPDERFNISPTTPTGVAYFDNRIYIVDSGTLDVTSYGAETNRGTEYPYYAFDLHSDQTNPQGITYLDGYFYVLEPGSGAVNDDIYIYPNKLLYDVTVPNLTRLQFTTRGTYQTSNAVRVRATFDGPVDITSDTTLRLLIGTTERQAVSITNYNDVTAGPQSNTKVAHFYYAIKASDTDIDGITTYDYPFSTTGTIKHTGETLSQHYLNKTTAYRVVQPGGINTLQPNRNNRVNALDQADWGETDSTAPDFIKRKPTTFQPGRDSVSNIELNTPGGNGSAGQYLQRGSGDNLIWATLAIQWSEIQGRPTNLGGHTPTVSEQATHALFEWCQDDSLGIQFSSTGTNPSSLSTGVVSAYTWAATTTFNAGQYILMRVPTSTTDLTKHYLQGSGISDLGGELTALVNAGQSGNI